MNENEFATGSVPVMVAARIYGKDASWVRAGIISGCGHCKLRAAHQRVAAGC